MVCSCGIIGTEPFHWDQAVVDIAALSQTTIIRMGGEGMNNSEAAALFMQGSGTADLVDSCELVSAASADSSVAALTDSFQLLTP